jgi:hypothetical protein
MADGIDPFAMEGAFGDQDREALVQAILNAYPNLDFLYLRLANKWGLRVGVDVINTEKPGRVVVTAIVDFAQAQGRQVDLLGLTWTGVQGNPKLKELATRFLPDQAYFVAKYDPPDAARVVAPEAMPPSLEGLVEKRSRLLTLSTFEAGLARLSSALCLVGTPEVRGTGFLVGRRTVLTNFHVVKNAIRDSLPGENIVCTFDYNDASLPNVRFSGAQDWLGLNSPYSESDVTGSGTPGPTELDFAIIRLAEEVEPTRQPLAWPLAPPIVAQRDFLLIGQHPGGGVAQIAFGEVVELPQSGLRYRYDVTTAPGSSGSPVLNLDLELVALHHAADPAANPRYNQAVPIARIVARLKEKEIDLATL